MARDIAHFDGTVIAPSGTYPYGDIKDAPSPTKVNRKSNADMIQFFQRMAANAGISLNNLPDNATNGFQFVQALNTMFCNLFGGMAEAFGTPTGTYVPVVMSGLASLGFGFTAGYVFYNGKFYYVSAYSPGSGPGPGYEVRVSLSTQDAQPVGSGVIATIAANGASSFKYSSCVSWGVGAGPSLAPQSWVTLSSFSSVHYLAGADPHAPRYTIDALGKVMCEGQIYTDAGPALAQPIFFFPVGFRPTKTVIRPIAYYNSNTTKWATLTAQILSTGAFSITDGAFPGFSGDIIDLGNIEFTTY